MGDLRNKVNCSVRGIVREFDIVPVPWAHYVGVDPELFRGPSDEWRLVDIFYVPRAVSTTPFGPPQRTGLLFPDTRPVDLDAPKEWRIRDNPRARALLQSLASVERALQDDDLDLESIHGVAGFGFDGELAALVFCGSLTLEDAMVLIDQTTKTGHFKAWSVIGEKPANVSHEILDNAFCCVGEEIGTPLDHPLLQTIAAHTPLCTVTVDDDLAPPLYPFYSRGAQREPSLKATLASPVQWAATIRAMDHITHFIEVGGSDKLAKLHPHITDIPISLL